LTDPEPGLDEDLHLEDELLVDRRRGRVAGHGVELQVSLVIEADGPDAERSGVGGEAERSARLQEDAGRAGVAVQERLRGGAGLQAPGAAETVERLPERDGPGLLQGDPRRSPRGIVGHGQPQGDPAAGADGLDDLLQRPVAEVERHQRGTDQPEALDGVGQGRGPTPDLRIAGLPCLPEGWQCLVPQRLQGRRRRLTLGEAGGAELSGQGRGVGRGARAQPGEQGHQDRSDHRGSSSVPPDRRSCPPVLGHRTGDQGMGMPVNSKVASVMARARSK
jgi:hypothetical protein